ncbi:MAG: PAS domain-containing sensor histidine kinase [Candidatus Obscuribacterales bacterium]|nr:PAS domain-containing sensor histidine kinase [Candidatus Obscuribacterales bacterium]
MTDHSQPDKNSQRKKLKAFNQTFIDSLEREQDSDDSGARARILAAVFDSIADGLIVFDENETVVMANMAGAQLAGVNLDGVTRPDLRARFQFFFDHGKTSIPPEAEPLIVAMREKQPCQMEAFVRGKTLPDGGRWVHANAAPILQAEAVKGGVTVFHDITERLQLAEQRNCLSALISHDIKNHLSAEVTFLDLLLHQLPDSLNPKLLKLIGELKNTNLRFLQISNSLLEMSRARLFGPEYRQMVDLVEVTNNVVELNQLGAAERSIRINVSVDEVVVRVESIAAVLHQVFHNLLQNAIEVSSDGQEVDISLGVRDGLATCEIVDHGPGMTEEQVEHLFDPARVASHQPMTTNSTGFGLYLSGILLAELGGKVSCSSEVGKGTVMKAALPAVLESGLSQHCTSSYD